jgi:hypothetical protein
MMAEGCGPETSGPILNGGANLLEQFFAAARRIARCCVALPPVENGRAWGIVGLTSGS